MRTLRARRVVTALGIAAALGGVGAAVAASQPPTNQVAKGRGVNEFGLTKGNFNGKAVSFTYDHGFFCDTSVKSNAATGCEAGVKWKKAPAKQHDPLFVVVPLGSGVTAPALECPSNGVLKDATNVTCVDHPGTIDLSALASTVHTLKPYDGIPLATLTNVLKNFPIPGHDHFLTDLNGGKPEWWDVQVVAVADQATYNTIKRSHSYKTVQSLIKAGKAIGPVPTNLFLFFGAK